MASHYYDLTSEQEEMLDNAIVEHFTAEGIIDSNGPILKNGIQEHFGVLYGVLCVNATDEDYKVTFTGPSIESVIMQSDREDVEEYYDNVLFVENINADAFIGYWADLIPHEILIPDVDSDLIEEYFYDNFKILSDLEKNYDRKGNDRITFKLRSKKAIYQKFTNELIRRNFQNVRHYQFIKGSINDYSVIPTYPKKYNAFSFYYRMDLDNGDYYYFDICPQLILPTGVYYEAKPFIVECHEESLSIVDNILEILQPFLTCPTNDEQTEEIKNKLNNIHQQLSSHYPLKNVSTFDRGQLYNLNYYEYNDSLMLVPMYDQAMECLRIIVFDNNDKEFHACRAFLSIDDSTDIHQYITKELQQRQLVW